MKAIPSELPIRRSVPLADRTTFGLGGAAELFLEAEDDATLARALEWARHAGVPVAILGGGSNVIVPDAGLAGLVIVPAMRGVEFDGGRARVAAGEPWDAFVAATVSRGLAGLEALSGIPGLVGATPIQNVGAYGVETSDVLVSVRALDRRDGSERTLFPSDLAFGYRDSALKRDATRFVVLEVVFALRPNGAPVIRYAELERAIAADPNLAHVRDTVIALRRTKGMVFDPRDPDGRSAGSFFTNPIVDAEVAAHVIATALARGVVASESEVPRWVQEDGRVKLAAGWLIERSGVAKGLREGAIGVSSKHALALVHHGGGSSSALLAFAERIVRAVRDSFGVTLEREPVVLAAT